MSVRVSTMQELTAYDARNKNARLRSRYHSGCSLQVSSLVWFSCACLGHGTTICEQGNKVSWRGKWDGRYLQFLFPSFFLSHLEIMTSMYTEPKTSEPACLIMGAPTSNFNIYSSKACRCFLNPVQVGVQEGDYATAF